MKLKFKITAGILALFIGISSFPAASGMSGGVPSQPSRNNHNRLDEARREIAIELGNMPPAQAAAVQNAAQDIVQNGANPENVSRFKKCLNNYELFVCWGVAALFCAGVSATEFLCYAAFGDEELLAAAIVGEFLTVCIFGVGFARCICGFCRRR